MPITDTSTEAVSFAVSVKISAQQRHQKNLQQAQLLLESYHLGDAATLSLFHQYIAVSQAQGYQPSQQDAQLVAAWQSMKVRQPNLEKLRKNAKGLLKQLRTDASTANHQQALARLRVHHPHGFDKPLGDFKLADAQWVIARECHFDSWPKLKRHIELLSKAESAASSGVQHDADLKTLHIRCGSDLQKSLPVAGLAGDFLEISNPFPQGRVPPSEPLEAFVEIRRQFIVDHYCPHIPQLKPAQAGDDFRTEEQRLRQLPGDYQRIVLWFEHDAFDQLCFAYIAQHLSNASLEGVVLELVQVQNYPGVERFIGLGQLSTQPQNLALLWQQRRTLTERDINIGSRIWQAFTGSNPTELWKLTQEKSSPLPLMQSAVLRMLQELPWKTDGLSLTQRLALELVQREQGREQEQGSTEGVGRRRLFCFLTAETEPLPYLGDLMFFSVLDELCQAREPALVLLEGEVEAGDVKPGEVESKDVKQDEVKQKEVNKRYRLTSVGQQLLAQQINWRDCGPQVRWLGGVEIHRLGEGWCWDSAWARPERY